MGGRGVGRLVAWHLVEYLLPLGVCKYTPIRSTVLGGGEWQLWRSPRSMKQIRGPATWRDSDPSRLWLN